MGLLENLDRLGSFVEGKTDNLYERLIKTVVPV